MMAHVAKELLWDISVYVIGMHVCMVAISVPGMAFVDCRRHLGESFGNGLILDEVAAEEAFNDLDGTDLVTRTL